MTDRQLIMSILIMNRDKVLSVFNNLAVIGTGLYRDKEYTEEEANEILKSIDFNIAPRAGTRKKMRLAHTYYRLLRGERYISFYKDIKELYKVLYGFTLITPPLEVMIDRIYMILNPQESLELLPNLPPELVNMILKQLEPDNLYNFVIAYPPYYDMIIDILKTKVNKITVKPMITGSHVSIGRKLNRYIIETLLERQGPWVLVSEGMIRDIAPTKKGLLSSLEPSYRDYLKITYNRSNARKYINQLSKQHRQSNEGYYSIYKLY